MQKKKEDGHLGSESKKYDLAEGWGKKQCQGYLEDRHRMVGKGICHLVFGMGRQTGAVVRKGTRRGAHSRPGWPSGGRWGKVTGGAGWGRQGWLPACLVMGWHCQCRSCQGWQLTGAGNGEYGRGERSQPPPLTREG